ncbi:uncharacterized protein LOC110452155 [Mizuhopecten yessoensis]|uniref:CUB domain-containing protein n=1 Tax=Mizuhopecten yessoensis TaxID=6573 RepID=A0A210QK82_MIZYE|nr:uncharacterized protein LOC110452155 [Mizuhopecten yessoensis]XP_021356191.1 uncharacterized protein LOC110452155 [Mizuhopecten yessoensis]OWF49149.1 hypothetical protein KP79_PYT23973 [Mizuhopecten yessoensis]
METITSIPSWLPLCAILCVQYLGEASQISANIDMPCNSGQEYVLGLGDYLSVGARGNQFFLGSCAIGITARDKNFKCNKICFSMDSFRFTTCDIMLSFYDSGVWNFGTAKPDFSGTCRAPARGDWCTSGTTAVVRLENLRGNLARMVGKYELQMTASARCSQEKADIEFIETDGETTSGGLSMTVMVGLVLGCIILCLLMAVILLAVMYRKKHQHQTYHQAATTISNTPISPDTSYRPVQETCGVIDQVDDDCTPALIKDKYNCGVERTPSHPRLPTAPPVDDCYSDLRPPSYSYCVAPPDYNGTPADNTVSKEDNPL